MHTHTYQEHDDEQRTSVPTNVKPQETTKGPDHPGISETVPASVSCFNYTTNQFHSYKMVVHHAKSKQSSLLTVDKHIIYCRKVHPGNVYIAVSFDNSC